MSVSVFDGVRLVVVGWQAECALQGTPDALELANTFVEPEDLKIPATMEGCVLLGRSMLKAELARRDAVRAATHVHTIDPDLRDDDCDGCKALVTKWREDQAAGEAAAKARKVTSLLARVKPLLLAIEEPISEDNNAAVDADRFVFLASAAMIADALGEISTAINQLNNTLDQER